MMNQNEQFPPLPSSFDDSLLNSDDISRASEAAQKQKEEDKILNRKKEEVQKAADTIDAALAKTDDFTKPEYFNPKSPQVNAAQPQETPLSIDAFRSKVDELEKTINLLENNQTIPVQERIKEELLLVKKLRETTLAKLEERVKEIEERKLVADKATYYAAHKEAAWLRDIEKQPLSTKLEFMNRELSAIHNRVVKVEAGLKGIPPRSEIKTEVEEVLAKAKERQAALTESMTAKYQDKAVLKGVGDDSLKERHAELFAILDQDPQKLLKNGDKAISDAIDLTKERQKFYFQTTFLHLIEEIQVLGKNQAGEEVTLFPNRDQRAKLEGFLKNLIKQKINQLEEARFGNMEQLVGELLIEINPISDKDIERSADNPNQVTYTTVSKLLVRAEQARNKIPVDDVKLDEQRLKLERGINKLKRLVDQFEFYHPEYLQDEELLDLMFNRNINAYDYPAWRSQNKDMRLFALRSEWMNRTESSGGLTTEQDMARARLKARYTISYFMGKLIAGKQLPEIDENEVLSTLKMALMTRAELIKGFALSPEGFNENGVGVRDMMWFIAKTAARKSDDVAADRWLNYADMSNIKQGAVGEIYDRLADVYPDEEGFKPENRKLAADGAILFRFLTSALVELMRQTQTGAHEVSDAEDSLLIENIFKYVMHVVLRYNQPEHPWVELLMFLREIPSDWAPSDAKLESAKHFMDLIIKYHGIFGDTSDFVGQIQSPGFMKALFPNMLELSGFMPNEVMMVGDKLFGYGNEHFADRREYITRKKKQQNGKVTIDVEEKITIEQRQSDKDFDFDVKTGRIVKALQLVSAKDGTVEGSKKLARVVGRGGVEVKGNFKEIKPNELNLDQFKSPDGDIDLDSDEVQQYVFENSGSFFVTESGERLRVAPESTEGETTRYLVGNFNLVPFERKNASGQMEQAYKWEKIGGESYHTVEDLDRPAFFIYENAKTKSNPKELKGAYIHQDEYGVWLYNAEGVPVGAFSDGKIWQINDERNKKKLATEIGFQANVYSDNEGKPLTIKDEFFLAGSTERRLGSQNEKIKARRTIRFFSSTRRDMLAKDFVFQKLDICEPNGYLEDPILKWGDDNQRLERWAQIQRDKHLPKNEQSIPRVKKYKKVAYVDLSETFAMNAAGTERIGSIDPKAGVVTKKEKDENGKERVVVIGKVNNENVIVNAKGEKIGFATYAVRMNDTQEAVGFVFPEYFDAEGHAIEGIPAGLRAAATEDDRDLLLGDDVNTYEKMQVAREAYQKLLESLPAEIGPIEADALVGSSKGDKSVIHQYFAGWLGKIKMQDGPHMAMYGAITKFMIFRWMQKVIIHTDGNTQAERYDDQKIEMQNIWFEVYTLLEGMLNDTGLSGAFTYVVEDVLRWMIDSRNKGHYEQGMNPAFTGLYWRSEDGNRALVDYLDAYFFHKKLPSPHKNGVGIGKGYGLDSTEPFAGIKQMELDIARLYSTAAGRKQAEALQKYKKFYLVRDLPNGIKDVPAPFDRKGAAEVKQEVKAEGKKK